MDLSVFYPIFEYIEPCDRMLQFLPSYLRQVICHPGDICVALMQTIDLNDLPYFELFLLLIHQTLTPGVPYLATIFP